MKGGLGFAGAVFAHRDAFWGRRPWPGSGESHVAVFGLGGVGSWCAEALARTGVGTLTLVDQDTVSESNCNRQLCATAATVGRPKAEVMAARLKEICPESSFLPVAARYAPDTRAQFFPRRRNGTIWQTASTW